MTLYGKADLGYSSGTTKNAAGVTTGKASGMHSGFQSGSRWGLKGSEDLGGGLKASFNYEASIGANTGSGNDNFARRSVLELSGGFGKIGMGRDYNPYFGVVGFSDVTGVDGSSTNNLLGGVRTSNMFLYTSPSFSGVTVKLGVSSEASGVGTAQAKTTSTDLSATYANGPLTVAVAQQTNKATTAAVAAVASDVTATPIVLGVAAKAQATTKTTNTAIGATYDLGMAKVYFNNLSSKTGGAKSTETNVGVSMPMGAATLLAGIGRDSDTLATGEKGSATDFVLGADYSLSKMTNIYARYYKQGASTSAAPAATGAAIAAANRGGKTTAFAVGVRHSF